MGQDSSRQESGVATERAPEPELKGQGGRRPLTADQQALALRYLPMARALARPLKEGWPLARDEFESAACMALVEAAQSFDPARNVKFATFARFRIQGALRDAQRALIAAGWREDVEHAPHIESLGGNEDEIDRILGNTPNRPVGVEIEEAEAVEAWLKKLPAKHAEACRLIYVEGKTQGEASEHLGCSKSRLSYLHKESIDFLNDVWTSCPKARRELTRYLD